MGKNKLARWKELDSWSNVIQPSLKDVVETVNSGEQQDNLFPSGNVRVKDHPVKGRWKSVIFKNNNPIELELGCGKGEYTTGLASRFPQNNFIGIDIKGARMWRGAKTASDEKLSNAAFLRTRIEFINSFFAEEEVDRIWITFPDPHPGAGNANKRLTSPSYLNMYRRFLKDRGVINLKTDSIELYNYSLKVVMSNTLELLFSTDDLYSGKLNDDSLLIRTHYENLFLNSGLKITFLSFRLEKNKIIS